MFTNLAKAWGHHRTSVSSCWEIDEDTHRRLHLIVNKLNNRPTLPVFLLLLPRYCCFLSRNWWFLIPDMIFCRNLPCFFLSWGLDWLTKAMTRRERAVSLRWFWAPVGVQTLTDGRTTEICNTRAPKCWDCFVGNPSIFGTTSRILKENGQGRQICRSWKLELELPFEHL